MRGHGWTALVAASAVAVLAGCSATGVEDNLSCGGFVQADIMARELLATPCSTNDDLLGNDSVTLVDLYFGRASETDTAIRPTEAQLDLVRANGGSIEHVFNVRGVRAWIPLSGVRAVVNEGSWVTAYRVADPDRHLVLVGIVVTGDLKQGDVDAFERAGGVVTSRLENIDQLYGWIDDSAIPCLRANPRFQTIEDAMGVACLAE